MTLWHMSVGVYQGTIKDSIKYSRSVSRDLCVTCQWTLSRITIKDLGLIMHTHTTPHPRPRWPARAVALQVHQEGCSRTVFNADTYCCFSGRRVIDTAHPKSGTGCTSFTIMDCKWAWLMLGPRHRANIGDETSCGLIPAIPLATLPLKGRCHPPSKSEPSRQGASWQGLRPTRQGSAIQPCLFLL